MPSRHEPGRLTAWLLASVLLCGPIAVAQEDGPDPSLANNRDRAQFLVGNAYFVLLHEFGHVLIRDLDIPVLGLEENAADTLAAMLMIKIDQGQPEREFRIIWMLMMAAGANRLVWETGLEREHAHILLGAQHELSIQRYHRIACLIYGSNPGELAWVPELAEMPDIRTDACEDEFAQANHAIDWVAERFARPRSAAGKSAIDIRYEPPGTELQELLLGLMRQEQVFETTVGVIDTWFDLPEAMVVKGEECGMPNAYWDPYERELVFCYEMLEALHGLADQELARQLRDGVVEALRSP